MFPLLNNHSYYSLLAGLRSPRDLAAAARQNGFSAIALTDRNRLTGSVEFAQACKAEGVRPIFGLEVKLESNQPLEAILLAKDAAGWASLCRLSSWLLSEENQEERQLPADLLITHKAGLICLVRGNGKDNHELLLRLKQAFGTRLYLQLLPGLGAASTERLATTLGLELAAIWPVFMMEKGQAELQKTLAAIRLNKTVDQLPDGTTAPADSFFPSQNDLALAFASYPRAITNSQHIAEGCQFELELDRLNFPDLDIPDGKTPMDALRERAYEGAHRLYPNLTPEIEERIEHELTGIQASGYTTLFLIMAEIVAFARQADVPLASRGSAASSLVAHCLGITTPDPIRLNLYFERFLNPARPTPPDIDTDICSLRRDIVIRHVYEHYGSDRVAMVATINRFRRRSALREVAKAHGLNATQIKAMVDTLPYRFWGPPGSLPQKSERPYGDLEERYRDPRSQLILKQAEAILDMPHHLSIHPGGIVIGSGPLTNSVPTQYSGKGVTITQYDLTGVQKVGLVKMDLLGIRGLTVLGDVADQIRAQNPSQGRSRLEVLENIPWEDEATAQNVRLGRTIGCFQIESPGMRATLKEVQADNPDNVMAALALFRPGPLAGGLKDAFIRRHLGLEEVSHIHPALSKLLEETHGVFLYQEQVLRVAHELAGFSLAESDLLRRAMSHFDPGKQMQTLKEKFIAGSKGRHNVPAPTAERIWDMMAAFAGYGFPKAHSASYALTAWRSAWCKTHYPAEFMAAVLANWGGYYSQETYLLEARRLGLAIHGPHINHSQSQFSVTYLDGKPHLYMGMDQLRDLTRETQNRILRLRPFDSLADFLTRAYPRKGEARNLIEVGALEGMGSIPDLITQLENGTWKRGQMPLFDAEPRAGEDWTVAQKTEAQERLLGVSLVAHPLDTFAEQIRAAQAISTVEAAAKIGQLVQVAGMHQTWRRVETSAGSYVYFTDLADFEGTLRVVIPNDVYLLSRSSFKDRMPLLIEGQVELGRDSVEPVLRASRVERLSA
jgi:DNA-directed DNA polymerase III PolC